MILDWPRPFLPGENVMRAFCMKKISSLLILTALAGAGLAQQPAQQAKKAPATKAAQTQKKPAAPARKEKQRPSAANQPLAEPTPSPTPDPEADRKSFDAAVAAPTTAEKATQLRAFIDQYPDSEYRTEAVEYLVTARATVGNELMHAGEMAEAVVSFRLAVEEAPSPMPDRLFNDVILKIPASLFYRDQRGSAMELASAIEKKVAANSKQLLGLAAFFIGIENGGEAKRIAERAVTADPKNPAAYQALGLAHRVSFELEEAARAYEKAIEIDPGLASARRSLAEMKRGLGKPDEAIGIYRTLLAADENDSASRTGLVLSLFGSSRQTEAETELAAATSREPRNFTLLTGVAYWYATRKMGDKAVEYAQRSLDIEPRYVWSHIALARGLMLQNRPVDAERTLIKARQYGNFPTLEYEIASARLRAGFFREATEELVKNFGIRDGLVEGKLGGRIPKAEKGFRELIAYERRASILEPADAEDAETAEKLLSLLAIDRELKNGSDETKISSLADDFVKGDDRMKLHRQLHIADLLLQRNVALAKAAELIKLAVGNADAGLDVSSPAAAVMASELYESRTIAFTRNEVMLIPEVPRQTLSAILRGRIEELAGWAFFQQKDYPNAVIRLRRAISVLPDKSAWWRSSMWRLATALDADGKQKEALDTHIKVYSADRPNAIRYAIIQDLYQKVNGTLDGLEEKIGPNPGTPIVAVAGPPKTEVPAAAKTDTAKDPVDSRQENNQTASQPPATKEPNPTVTTDTPPAVVKAEEAKPAQEPERKVGDGEQTAARQPVPVSVLAGSNPAEEEKKPVVEVPKTEQPNVTTGNELTPPPLRAEAEPVKSEEKVDKRQEPAAGDASRAPGKPQDKKVEDAVPQSTAEPPPISGRPEQNAGEPKETSPAVVKEEAPAMQVEQKPEITFPQPPPTEPAKDDKPKNSDASTEPKNLMRDPFIEKMPDPNASTSEKKTEVLVQDPLKSSGSQPISRDLFEPVIIKVQSDPAREAPPATKPTEPRKTQTDEAALSGARRSRVIEGKEITSDQRCSINVSPENISLLNGGGSLGVLVTISGEGTTGDVAASTTSPRDIQVKAEPEIEGLAGRRFYVIKSISTRTGVFSVNFESPCGKKEISVRVR